MHQLNYLLMYIFFLFPFLIFLVSVKLSDYEIYRSFILPIHHFLHLTFYILNALNIKVSAHSGAFKLLAETLSSAQLFKTLDWSRISSFGFFDSKRTAQNKTTNKLYNIQSTSTLEGIARKSDRKHYQENSLKYKQNAKI